MLRSKVNDEGPNDFHLIREDEHVALVWQQIEKNFEKYFATMIQNAINSDPTEVMLQKMEKHPDKKREMRVLNNYFNRAVAEYEKECRKYREFFDRESLQEFLDTTARTFKSMLRKQVPIIRYAVNSTAEFMKDWQMRFQVIDGSDLLGMFVNLIDFKDDYLEKIDPSAYAKYDHADEFNFDEIEEEEYGIVGVIAMGIKSAVLFHIRPDVFPRRDRIGLFGIYFLTEMKTFKLPSGTSEFIMIDDTKELRGDHNYKMDQNYWYPYGLYAFYAIRLYRKLKERCAKLKINLEDDYRYVYVDAFLTSITKANDEYVRTMMTKDEDR